MKRYQFYYLLASILLIAAKLEPKSDALCFAVIFNTAVGFIYQIKDK